MAVLLARVLGGVMSSFGGVYFLYEYLVTLQKESNLLFLFLFILCIGAAIFLLITGARLAERIVSGAETIKKMKLPQTEFDQEFEKVLKRNNAISTEWNKTQKQRDQIKLLEVQANAESSS